MSQSVRQLSARWVETVAKPGRYHDGNGIYLVVSPAGAKRWVYIFYFGGRRCEMGLGPLRDVSLAEARKAAARARLMVQGGLNPIVERRRARRAAQKSRTFGDFAEELLADIVPGFRNPKHRAQWVSTLRTYGKPLWALELDAIETDDILRVLRPIWTVKPVTASRVRGRIERVLDAAKARGLRQGENPACWRGHLAHLLPRQPSTALSHYPALDFEELPAFMRALGRQKGNAARALELCILTAVRTSEILLASWGEIDLDAAVWTIPAARTKAARPHRVPLSAPALEILDGLPRHARTDWLFPGVPKSRPLSSATMAAVLRRMERRDITVHGFRSTFRDWVGETTSYPADLAEAALAHVVGTRTERAYRRGDALERRRPLMEEWARYAMSRRSPMLLLEDDRRRGLGDGAPAAEPGQAQA